VPSEIPVEAVGTGLTREKAIDNALLSAVQQAVGVLVVSDVTVESNRVIRDFVANSATDVFKGEEQAIRRGKGERRHIEQCH
jgi:hypothetical protein